jgi:cell cycle checkpoint protein
LENVLGLHRFCDLVVTRVDDRYRFAAVKMGLKAMLTGTKVSVRIDGEGVLSMNFMIDIEGKNCFVEFRVRIYKR